MGCDIHGVVEINDNTYSNDYWDGVVLIDDIIDRSYVDFAILFNVRNYEEIISIADNRGLPNNISYETKEIIDGLGIDAHSKTWINLEELEQANKEYDFGKDWTTLIRIMKILKNTNKKMNVRLVVWFDN